MKPRAVLLAAAAALAATLSRAAVLSLNPMEFRAAPTAASASVPLLSAIVPGPSALALPAAPALAPSAAPAAALPAAAAPAPAAAALPQLAAVPLQSAASVIASASGSGADARREAALDGLWNGAPAANDSSVVDALVTGGAGPEFVARVKNHLRTNVPEPILRDMLADGYRIEVNARVRQGREDLHEDNDYTGGFHSYGPEGKFIVVAEEILHKKSGEWRKSVVWENAVNHEIGHAAAYILGERAAAAMEAAGEPKEGQAQWYATKGVSESPEFREAWRLDFESMPESVKTETGPEKSVNDFYYFDHPDENGWYQRARQETFAEGFDILLRGPRSSYNYANFMKYFPRSLAEIRAALERAYGPIFSAR